MEEMILQDAPPSPPPKAPSPVPITGVTKAVPEAGKGGGKGKSKTPSGQTPYTISVTVTRGGDGYGFSVAWTRPPRVETVDPGSPAEEAGLMAGDYIIFVGHHNIVKAEEDAVLDMIRDCGDKLPLEVYRRGVSKPPRGLANGTTLAPSEPHPRSKLSHISFTSEGGQGDRQSTVFALLNCEQAFCDACRYGIERYLIPLKFRTDILTQTEHDTLFNNMDQLVDLSELLIDRMMGNSGVTQGEDVGQSYYLMLDEFAEYYVRYMGGLPEADKVLAVKYQETDFKEFLQVPPVPRKKPDITTFIHKPAEHLRELLGLLSQVYTSTPGHDDNAYLDTVLDKLKMCYWGVTSQQNIMEPTPPVPPTPPTTDPTPTSPAHAPLRPPLVSVADIEKRLVFTKFAQPFQLDDGVREWLFGGELHKFEGRHLREYWAMLFSDLILFTKMNRDRVIFVMEDPVPIAAVCQACFTVKKKATEFRLIIDTRMKVAGTEGGYLTNRSRRDLGTGSLRRHKKTLVLRAPTVDLKATWNNLIRRQLYLSIAGSLNQTQAASVSRATSSESLDLLATPVSRFTSSVGDLRRGLRDDQVILDLDDDEGPSSSSCFNSSSLKLTVRRSHGREEELVLEDDDEYRCGRPTSLPASSSAPHAIVPLAKKSNTATAADHHQELKFAVEDEPCESSRSPSRRGPRTSKASKSKSKAKPKAKAVKSPRTGKGKRGRSRGNSGGSGGGVAREEEVVLNLDQEESGSASRRSAGANQSALQNSRWNGAAPESTNQRAMEEHTRTAADYGDEGDKEDEEDEALVIEDARIGQVTRIKPKKGKGIGGKVKDKLFPNRNLPTKKKMNKTKKVEKYVDSLETEDLENHGRVTPIFVGEEGLSTEDFSKKRKELLLRKPRNFVEGAEEEIVMGSPYMSPIHKTQQVKQKKEKAAICIQCSEEDFDLDSPHVPPNYATKESKKEEKKTALKLEGIEENGTGPSCSSPPPVLPSTTMLSPEEYEEYIGDALEKDYPELTGVSTNLSTAQPEVEDYGESKKPHQEESYQESCQQEPYYQQESYQEEPCQQEQYDEQQQQQQQQQQQELEQQQQQQQQQQQHAVPQPTGPLSGSASMNFMDDHSPTGNGVAETRGLKRYGSSCDIDRLIRGGAAKEPAYTYDDDDDDDDDYNGNGNFDANLTSKVGGTGSGAFVAGKLAMFEKVVEEEHQKFIEGQEVRQRIFRLPRKGSEYIEKFHNPQVIDNIEKGNNPRYYDEYEEYTSSSTPYGGCSSPPNITKGRTSHSTYYDLCRPTSPTNLISTSKSPSPVLRFPSPVFHSKSRSSTTKSPPLSPLPTHTSCTPKSPLPTHKGLTPRFKVATPSTDDDYDYARGGGGPMSPDSTGVCSPVPACSSPPRTQDQRTDEAQEMLDMSYLGDVPLGVEQGGGPARDTTSPPPAGRGSRDSESSGRGYGRYSDGYQCGGGDNGLDRCMSPLPTTTTNNTASSSNSPQGTTTTTIPPPVSASSCPLDDVFGVEDAESMGSITSIGGRRTKRAAPKRPPTPPNNGTTTASSNYNNNNNNRIGGFFGRVKKGTEADVKKVRKPKEEKQQQREETKTAGGGGGKRFQLFSGGRKSSEPSPSEDSPRSPKKEKAGKKRLFGLGKENLLGRSPNIEQNSDPQVARMSGNSFDQESINLDGEEEEIL